MTPVTFPVNCFSQKDNSRDKPTGKLGSPTSNLQRISYQIGRFKMSVLEMKLTNELSCFLEEGLRLFVGPGGSTSFGSHHLPNRYVA